MLTIALPKFVVFRLAANFVSVVWLTPFVVVAKSFGKQRHIMFTYISERLQTRVAVRVLCLSSL